MEDNEESDDEEEELESDETEDRVGGQADRAAGRKRLRGHHRAGGQT